MTNFFEDIKKGFKIGTGIFASLLLFSLLIFGIVYAFVEPTSGPTSNYFYDFVNPLYNSVSGLSANNGQYDNRIPSRNFSAAYTEICFKNSAVYNDTHSAGQSTSGGNCAPGEVGFVIEQNERSAAYWEGKSYMS